MVCARRGERIKMRLFPLLNKSKVVFKKEQLILLVFDLLNILILFVLMFLFVASVFFLSAKYDLRNQSEQIYSQYGSEDLKDSGEKFANWMSNSISTSKDILRFIAYSFVSFLAFLTLFIVISSLFSTRIWRSIRKLKQSYWKTFKVVILRNGLISYTFLFVFLLLAKLMFNENINIIHVGIVAWIFILFAVYFIFISNAFYNFKKGLLVNLRLLFIISLKYLIPFFFLVLIILLLFILSIYGISFIFSPFVGVISSYFIVCILLIIILVFYSWARYFIYLVLSDLRGVKHG
jgi:hypothetical protein